METSLRIILVLVGVVILGGILWDARKNKKPKISQKRIEREDFVIDETLGEEDLGLGPVSVKAPSAPSVATAPKKAELIMLHLMARAPDMFYGKRLAEAFREAHLYYGEMQIFHRHEEMDGSGHTLFSVASAVEPGYFESAQMEAFKTPGVTFFFELGEPNFSIAAFEVMLRTAKQIALRLDGDLKDPQHRLLTVKEIEHYRERVRQQTPLLKSPKTF